MSSLTLKLSLFFDWWLAGLKTLCPEFVRSALILDVNRVSIEIDNEHITFKHYLPSSNDSLDIRKFNINDELEKDAALSWLKSKQQKPTKLIVTIPEKSILIKTIQFPAAANNNLREALGFEINRRTPFTSEQVYYDYSVISHDKNSGKLKIDLVIVPRAHIDPLMKVIDKLGIQVDEIISDKHSVEYTNINLLPENIQPVTSNKNITTHYLAGITFFLFIATLYIPVNKQSGYIDDLEIQLQLARKSAVTLNSLIKEKETLLKQINFLHDKKSYTINNINILNETTKIIPDDTWLSRFSINNNQLQIQGESSSASALIQSLESSDYFRNVQFKSPVTRNNRTGKDKFNISASLEKNS
jgi:general secretion pathway protein L